MTRDPRRSNRYMTTRRAWLAGYAGGAGTCCLCGGRVDTSLPGTHPLGPTIEHRLPVRQIRAMVRTWAEAVALACDTSMWALAHNRCQAGQGARVVNAQRRARREVERVEASRRW